LPHRMAAHRDNIVRGVQMENVSVRLTHPSLLSIPWVAAVARPSCTAVGDRELPLLLELDTGPNVAEEDAWVSAAAFLRVYRHFQAQSES
jgi:hypothetical protein